MKKKLEELCSEIEESIRELWISVLKMTAVQVQNDKGETEDLNLFVMFWYATMLPGFIGLILILLGIICEINTTIIAIGFAIVAGQLAAWNYWYFGTQGSPSHWMILIVAGEMIGFRKAGRFFCPRFGNLFVVIVNNERLQVQAIFGDRGKNLDGAEEVGAILGPIRHSKMLGDEKKLGFPPDDPLNLDTTEARPEVSVLITNVNPIKIKRLEVFDEEKGCRTRSGISVALGQVAEDVRKGYQEAVIGKSISWVPAHLEAINKSIKSIISEELRHRGLHIEDHTNPSINNFGETAEMKANIKKVNDAKVGGQAKVEEEKKNAEAKAEIGRGITTLNEAESKAKERMAEADAKKLAAQIRPMQDAGIPNERIADILEQGAIKLGYPRLPDSVTSLIYGASPELWKGVDENDSGAPATKKKEKDVKNEKGSGK